MLPVVDLSRIRAALHQHTAVTTPTDVFTRHAHAAVALLLRESPQGPEILYILRAEYEGDPWSGNIGFPGGHIEPYDPSLRHAAERETREELDIDLTRAELLGQLDDITGAHLPIVVACYVWLVPATIALHPSSEVVDAFWVPLSTLADPARQRTHQVEFRGETLVRPAIDLLGPRHTVLWGITYRFTSHFLNLIGIKLPHTPIP